MSFYELPHMRHNTSTWSAIRVEVLAAESPEQLTHQVNLLIDNGNYNVLAVSAARITATFAAESWTSTLILQEKVDPLNGGRS